MEEFGKTKDGTVIWKAEVSEIVIPDDRIRQHFDRKKMDELVESMRDKGQIQWGICKLDDGKPVLVAGERRLRACDQLNIPFTFCSLAEVDPVKIKEIELEENICRADITFQERALALQKLHQLRQEIYGESGRGKSGGARIKDTAEYLGMSKSTLAEELEIAQFLQLEPVRQAKNRTEAKNIIKRLTDEYARSEALKKAQKESGDAPSTLIPAEERGKEVSREEALAQLAATAKFYDPMVVHGEMEEVLAKESDEKFNIVIFDPPWGVDFDKVFQVMGAQRSYEDEVARFQAQLEGWLDLLWRKMAEHSHLYLFFGIVNHSFVYSTLEKVGFEVNWMPIFWHKIGAHRTRSPEKWPGRSYEAIAYARKGRKDLVARGVPDIIATTPPSPKLKASHPSAKHPDVMRNLIKRSAMPGDWVLDPMCGSGMTGVAAETFRPSHELRWLEIEKEETWRDLALANVIKGYPNLILKDQKEDAAEETISELEKGAEKL